jgi:hypothetical protein
MSDIQLATRCACLARRAYLTGKMRKIAAAFKSLLIRAVSFAFT